MRARNLAIVSAVLVSSACSKQSSDDTRKPRKEITVWLDPKGDVPADDIVVSTSAPPKERQMLERNGVHLAIVGIPADGDPAPMLEKAILEAERAGSNGTIIVSTRCLLDLQQGLEKNISPMWTVPLIVGAHCNGGAKDRMIAAALVEAGSASKVKITFDVHTGAFMKVDPSR